MCVRLSNKFCETLSTGTCRVLATEVECNESEKIQDKLFRLEDSPKTRVETLD